MASRKVYIVLVGLMAVGALIATGVATAASTSTFTFSFSPSAVPKTSFKAGALTTDLITTYTTPADPVERTQIFLDKNFKVDPSVAAKCSESQLSAQTMAGAMAACKNALVGTGKAKAQASFGVVNACVLLFNGPAQNGLPTLQVFTRAQSTPGSQISCSNPSNNNQGNATILLKGVLKAASAPYGKVLDVDKITQSSPFPLTDFKTTIGEGNYLSAKCAASDKTWRMQTTWTYKSNAKTTVKKTQPCTVKESPPNTKITSAKINQKKHKATFKFKATGAQATGFECQLKKGNKGSFKRCGSPKTYKHLKKGKYTFKVRAVGPGGKDGSPATKGFKIKK